VEGLQLALFRTGGSADGSPANEETQPRASTNRSVVVGRILLVIAFATILVLGLSPAPYVIEQPGPVFNTLGYDHQVWPSTDAPQTKKPLISIPDEKTYPTSGALDLLTVGVVGNPKQLPSWLDVVGAWFTPSKAVIPVDVAYPPTVSVDQQNAENAQMMVDSQKDAVAAALNQLGYTFPQKVAVKQIIKGSPADGKLRVGDDIVSVNGKKVAGIQALRDALAKNGHTEAATIGVERGGTTTTVRVTPELNQGSVILGIGAGMDYTFPSDVKIQLDDVGGPSAGQMFALGIIDKLSSGKLNGGAHVAGTGTIDNEGNIGAIGGIQQKMYGARSAGADWFLAPSANCDEVTGHIPGGLTVFAVKKLTDSLKVLDVISHKGDTSKLPSCPTH
jgi:PDZ domain-containing protein